MKKGSLHVSVNGVFIITLILLVVPLSFLIVQDIDWDSNNLMTGLATGSAVFLFNDPPVITISNFFVLEGDLVNISNCAYDPNGHNVTCAFSPPLHPTLGTWQTNVGDAGPYQIQINATDQTGALSTKNVTMTITPPHYNGTCELFFEVFPDNNINVTWNPEMNTSGGTLTNYTNFTISYIDTLDANFQFDDSKATNVSGLHENGYYDPTANTTEYRFYKLYADDGINFLTCNKTFGKKLTYLTPDNGRWNYVSSPFIDPDTALMHFTQSVSSDLDYAYKYNHQTGVFDFYSYAFSFGSLSKVNTGDCVLLQPTNVNGAWITVTGEPYANITRDFTINNGRWNYMGWIIDNTTRTDAFSGYESDLDYLYTYNHQTGVFDFYSFVFNFGTVNLLEAGRCSLVQPRSSSFTYNYSAYP